MHALLLLWYHHLELCCGLLLRPREPDLEDDESVNEAKIAWKAWMKESITLATLYRVMCLIVGRRIQLNFLG